MKKLILSVLVAGLMVACGSETTDSHDTDSAESNAVECDANDLMSAANCVCEMLTTEDALYEDASKSDDEIEAYSLKIDNFYDDIFDAIDAGKYTEEELEKETQKIGCDF